MTKQWKELKETITEIRDNNGTSTKQEVCEFLVNYMEALEKQMQEQKTEQALDKIRAEIEEERKVENIPEDVEMWHYIRALDRVLSIIDKYKPEGSDNE